MTMTYQQQHVLDGLAGRAVILDLDARHNRLYSAGDRAGWVATFRHAGATYVRAGQNFTDLGAAFDGATGVCTDSLIYERGGWYFTSRELNWDLLPREDALPV